MDALSFEALGAGSGEPGRAGRLKAATRTTHERLDKAILDRRPFADRRNYGRLLEVQFRFHRDLAPVYRHPRIRSLIPDLENRQRLDLIRLDLRDLGMAVPDAPVHAGGPANFATALGWLYVSEGSNLGAALLLKEAAKLGLSEAFGARHLAAAPEGRRRHWKTFVAALDAIDLPDEDEDRVVEGAREAFRGVHRHVIDLFG